MHNLQQIWQKSMPISVFRTKKTSTSPKGEEVVPGIKQLLGKAQYLEFVWKQVVNQIG